MWQVCYMSNNGEIKLSGEFFDTEAEAEARAEYLDEENDVMWNYHYVKFIPDTKA